MGDKLFFVGYCHSSVCSDFISYPDNQFFLHLQPKFWDQSMKKTDCSGYDFHLLFTYINTLFKRIQYHGAEDEWSVSWVSELKVNGSSPDFSHCVVFQTRQFTPYSLSQPRNTNGF